MDPYIARCEVRKQGVSANDCWGSCAGCDDDEILVGVTSDRS
jgi:hypothetical protein